MAKVEPQSTAGQSPSPMPAYQYVPRESFIAFHNRTARWAVLICHRRSGKTIRAIAGQQDDWRCWPGTIN